MKKTFSIAMLNENMAKWKIRLIDGILYSIPALGFKKANQLVIDHGIYDNGVDFVDAIRKACDIKLELYGTENLPATGPVTVVANHPGGADVVAAVHGLASIRPDVVILANEFICVPPLKDIVIPVSTLAKKKVNFDAVHQAYKEGKVVVFFAAGKNSRYDDKGLLRDRRWRTTYLDFAQQYKTPINILRIEAKNSKLFYKVSNFRSRFKQLKNVPLENMFQLKELITPCHVPLYLSKSLDYIPNKEENRLEKRKTADKMYEFLYSMGENNLEMKER